MSRPLVYVALQQFCEFDDRPLRALLESGFEVRLNDLRRRLKAEEIPQRVGEAEAVLAGVEPYDAGILASLPRLRCISRCGTGTESIDLEAAQRHRIAVLTTPEEVVEPVAQMTVAMIFGLARHFPEAMADFRNGLWQKRVGALLSEWTIGLVGFGRIGRAVERHLRPFEPRVLAADPHVSPAQVPPGVSLCSLEQLLGQSDLVSLHAGRRSEEGVLLGRKELSSMKPGSRLVNTARGRLVDQGALYDLLVAGHLSAAALDVFEEEPFTGPLTRLPQVLCTPHAASLTRASRLAMELRCARNVVEFFRG